MQPVPHPHRPVGAQLRPHPRQEDPDPGKARRSGLGWCPSSQRVSWGYLSPSFNPHMCLCQLLTS